MRPFRAEVVRRDGGLALRFGVTELIYENSTLQCEAPILPMRALSERVFEVDGLTSASGRSEVRFVPGRDGYMRFLAPPLTAHLLGRVLFSRIEGRENG